MNFQQIVIIVATIILILMLIIIANNLRRNKENKTYPPALSECPDFWVSRDVGCENPTNLGKCGKGPITFSRSIYKGHDGNCNKAKWARNCQVTWDGITNNDQLNKCR